MPGGSAARRRVWCSTGVRVAGVDGAPGGWVVAVLEAAPVGPAVVEVRHEADAAGVVGELAAARLATVCVDMPIGLADSGRRDGEADAARRLGPRRSSLFLTPPRPVLTHLDDWAAANAVCRRTAGMGLSKQAFHLLPRIAELDDTLAGVDSDVADRVVEAHPELAFTRLLGHPARHAKRRAAGVAERLVALETAGLEWRPHLLEPVAGDGDDVIDALAIGLTALAIAAGDDVLRFGAGHRDARGRPVQLAG
jgi:predicted RNase H-like nuclease